MDDFSNLVLFQVVFNTRKRRVKGQGEKYSISVDNSTVISRLLEVNQVD